MLGFFWRQASTVYGLVSAAMIHSGDGGVRATRVGLAPEKFPITTAGRGCPFSFSSFLFFFSSLLRSCPAMGKLGSVFLLP